MRKPLEALITALSLGLGLLLSGAGPARADWGWESLGTGSLELNLFGSANVASVDLENCADGKIATWHKDELTFSIVNPYVLDLHIVQAIRAGVLEWIYIGGPYALSEVSPGEAADITIEVVPFISLTHLGGANVSCASGSAGIQHVDVIIAVQTLTAVGLQNVAAHETGHALGLDHARTGARVDLMNSDFALLTGSTTVICPSNLDVAALSAKSDPFSMTASSWSRAAAC